MRMNTDKTPKSSGWLAKAGRLLIFTATLGVLLAAGLAGPQDASAVVTVGAEFSAPTASVATGIGSMAAITGTFAVGAGQNRLLLVVAQWEAGAAANTSSFTSGTWGGQNLTSLFNTFNSGVSRNRQWIGYLTETQIRAAVGTTLNLNITTSANPTGWQVKAAWFTGVNQTTPINHFVNNNDEAPAATTHTFGATALNVINGGRAYYFETTNGGVTYTPPPGWTEMYDGNDPSANMARTSGGVVISSTTTTNPTITQAAAGTRYTVSAVSLNPAITNVGNGTGFPADKTVFANETNKAVDSFTLFTTGFTDTLSQVVVVGTNTANVTASGVKIYRDSGGTANEWDVTDTLMATSTFSAGTATFTTFSTPIAATTTTTQYIVTYDIIGSPTVSQTLTGLVTSATGSNTTLLNDSTSATLTIGSSDATPPTPGTVTVTPDTGAYINANPQITTTFTDNESSVTNCWYTTDGTWPGTAGALSGSSPTWTCTANPVGLSGAVTLNMRALSTGGTGTASALSRTVDSTVPTDGTLTVTPGDTLNDLSWPGFADAASGLRSANTYTIKFLTGASAPANCGTGSVVTGYGGTATVFSHTGLVNGTQYSYRICAYDNVNNGPSAGATGSGTPASSPPDQLTASGNTPLAVSPKTDTAAFVAMQRFAMNSNNTGNGSVRLTGLGIDDIGTAGTIAAVRIYTSMTLSTGIPSDAALIGRISNWPGTPQVINLNIGTVADRTVVTGPTSTKYGYVVYDMFDGTTGLTTRASVTALYAASPDTVNAFASFLSNTITLTTGAKATVTACTDCHGNPPVDGPRSATTGSFLGSHTQHANSQPANLGLACTVCHPNNGTNTGHRDGSIDMLRFFPTFTGTYSKGTLSAAGTLRVFPQSDNPSFAACNGVYCHSTVQGAGGSGAGTDKPQTWGAAGPLSCGACHLNMRTDPSAPGSHVAHAQTAALACNNCHTGYTENSVTMSTHANYTIEVNSGLTYTNTGVPGNGYGGCTTASCHASAYSGATVSTPLWGLTAGCDACHRTPGAFASYGSPSWGSHGKHVDSQGYLCDACHVGAVKDVSGGANHVDGNIDVTNGYPVTAKHSPGSGYSKCTNASCHGSPYTTATAVTPTWGVSGAGCGSCHTAPGQFASYGSPTWGSHGKHVDSQGYGCNECHTSTALKDVSGGAEHGDGNIDVYAVTPYDLKYGSGPTITKHSPGSGYTRCFSASCHASPYSTASAVTPSWGLPGGGCAMCHIAPGAFASYGSPSWGAHGKHLNTYSFVCGDCHTGAVVNVSGGAQHGDGNIDVSNSYPVDVVKHSPGTYAGNCSNTYCHSGGTGGTLNAGDTRGIASNTSPIWSNTTACNSCHGTGGDGSGQPNYANWTTKANSHAAHLPWNTTKSCNMCHYGTTQTGTTITNFANHDNKTYELVPYDGAQRTWASLARFAYTYNNTGGTCATSNCHGGQSPRWGTPGSSATRDWDCIGCHSFSFPKRLGGLGTIRQVAGVGGDFNRAYRHLRGATTIVKWDCVVCHMEGQHTGNPGAVNWTKHYTDGLVSLRDVDNPTTGWDINNRAWGTTDYTNMDLFCLNCHDANGASGINVNATNNGLNLTNARALTPFNTTQLNAAGWFTGSTNHPNTPRTRVNNLKDKFFVGAQPAGANYVGNPSQHAVIGRRYSTVWTAWQQQAWGSTYLLKKDGRRMNVARETAILTCADCHVIDAGVNGNAHGANTPYLMWTTSLVDMCWRCHNSKTYVASDGSTVTNGSIIAHGDIDGGRGGQYTAYGLTDIVASWNCLLCHASWVGYTTVDRQATLGGIHGSWKTSASWVTTAGTPYRFTPGVYFKITPPGGVNGAWGSGGTPGCYFIGDNLAATSWTNCDSHNVQGSAAGAPPRAYSRPVNY